MNNQVIKEFGPWLIWMALVMFISFIVWIFFFPPSIQQPLSFNHAVHEEFGCVTCHEGVETQVRATLPEFDLCMMCHDEPPVTDPAEIEMWGRAVDTEHIDWKRLRTLDDHTYFSHRRHVGMADLECATCHGDMGSQTTPPTRALKPMSMKICMDCHTKENITNDCASCHI